MSQGLAPRMRLVIARKPLAAACIAALLASGMASAQDTPPPAKPADTTQQHQAPANQTQDAN